MKNIHIISHSHWDREWYMPFEYHRARLVKLIDACINLFENDGDFRCFYLDGHTVGIEDYLEIKPYNREKLKKYISEGRLAVGPWYVLQDEFLTSSEANIRNLLTGIKTAKEFGKVSMVGYFPDSFGNAGQMPQILKQAGMKAVVFGRGVKPTGMNNTVSDFEDYASQFSEMYWQSPDGSSLPAILFANWYNNGAEIPAEPDREYWDRRISDMQKYASAGELLLMNGSDHMPVQTDLSKAIKTAQSMYPEYNFIHSDFERYADAMTAALPEDLSVISGELTNQNTDGWWALVNTASSHVYLKQMNRRGEILLESVAEPVSAAASLLGKKYPHDMLEYSWKTLMKNHPHDSICGCSVDEVNDEMRTRFIKSRQAAETVVKEGLEYIADCIDVSAFNGCEAVFSVINTYSKTKSEVISVEADISRVYGTENLNSTAERINSQKKKDAYCLVDEAGRVIPCSISEPKARFGYELPDDRFRKPYMAETVSVTFEAQNVPPMGYKSYGLKKCSETAERKSFVTGKNTMENQWVKVVVNQDGTVDLTDKETGRIFKGLLNYEDVGDIGNEYTFIPVNGDVPVTSEKFPAETELVSDEEYRAVYKISTVMEIPESADGQHEKEKMNYVHFTKRTAGRSRKLVSIPVRTYVSLEKNGRGIKVRTEFVNTAKDHRLRVLIPTGMKCSTHKAESVFEAVERNNSHKPCWTYPSGCEHQQGFVMLKDGMSGILAANIGLYEYEILKDNTIAVTLVRAVGELGDWGVFPTELSQCLRPLSLEYEIAPFKDDDSAYEIAAGFQYPMQSVQNFKCGTGTYKNGEFEWSGNGMRMTAFKKAQDGNDLIMRWVNYSDAEQKLRIKKSEWLTNIYKSNVTEEKLSVLEDENGEWSIEVKPFEILTLGSVN